LQKQNLVAQPRGLPDAQGYVIQGLALLIPNVAHRESGKCRSGGGVKQKRLGNRTGKVKENDTKRSGAGIS